jgi:predicted secreted protein
MKKKILFTAHCILNTASKVVMYNDEETAREEALRRRFVLEAVEGGIQLVQLPCPEFLAYGSRRWGHTADQFDHPFFRDHCRKLLEPHIRELKAYLEDTESFEVLGFIGIDGSPSCGVDYTCAGPWGGNPSGRDDLEETLAAVRVEKRPGVFIAVLAGMLREQGIDLPLTGLDAGRPDRIMDILKKHGAAPGFQASPGL